MKMEYARREPKVDPYNEFTLLSDECLDERENTYAEWITNNILEEDGRPVDNITQAPREAEIDVDNVMEKFRMTSYSKEGHRQLHHDDWASDVESSDESGPSFHGGNEDDNRENDNGKNDQN